MPLCRCSRKSAGVLLLLALSLAAPAPEAAPLSFFDETGAAHRLDDFRGKVVLLSLWASWCTPCLRELPTLDEVQRAFGGRGLQVVALNSENRRAHDIAQLYLNLGVVNLPIYIDPTQTVSKNLDVKALPVTLIIDPGGALISRVSGAIDWTRPDMLAMLDEILEHFSKMNR